MKVVTHTPDPVPVPGKTYDFIGLTRPQALLLTALIGRTVGGSGDPVCVYDLYCAIPTVLHTASIPLRNHISKGTPIGHDLNGFDWSS